MTTTQASTTKPPATWQPRARTSHAEWGKVSMTVVERPAGEAPYLVGITLTKPYKPEVPFRIWRGDVRIEGAKVANRPPGDYGDSVQVPNTPQANAALGAIFTAADGALDKAKPFKAGEHVTGINPLAGGADSMSFSRHDPNDDSFRNEYFAGPRGAAPADLAALAQSLLKAAEDNGLRHRLPAAKK